MKFRDMVRRWRRAAAWWAMAGLLVLAACGGGSGNSGPGSGGTGNGGKAAAPNHVVLPLCGAAFAAALDCPVTTDGLPSAQGTQPVHLADGTPTAKNALDLQGNLAAFAARCRGMSFTGEWGSDSSDRARFYGVGAIGTSEFSATLVVTDAGGGALTLQVLDANGRNAYGPVTLQRVAAATTAASCP